MSVNFDCDPDFLPSEMGSVPIAKYKSKKSGMTVYFADVDSPVINGYFCIGTDQPEAPGIEQLIHHLDSSGGLLPRAMRGEMLRPAWQFHGAENPLADRDQSCYVCCSLGEHSFLGTFSCAAYLLQNLEAVMELHGYPCRAGKVGKPTDKAAGETPETPNTTNATASGDTTAVEVEGAVANLSLNDASPEGGRPEGLEVDVEIETDEEGDDVAPKLEEEEYYALSEAGEGAMAWEATLQSMFPDCPAFWNRLLSDGRFNRLSSKMRRCYDRLYRPDNLTVIITGRLSNREHVLEVLHDHEVDYYEGRQTVPPLERPWCKPLQKAPASVTNTAWFVCRNPLRKSMPTVCVGWRGCPSTDLETSMAIKVLSAHLAVGPIWTQLVTAGSAHRISWCQLEYADICSLITVHGLSDPQTASSIPEVVRQIVDGFVSEGTTESENGLKLDEIRGMADRVGWHYIREFESEPFLMIASAISKAERYGEGSKDQVKLRLRPRLIFDELAKKPLDFWLNILKTYFKNAPLFCTQVLPKHIPVDASVVSEQQVVKEDSSGDFAASSRRAASRPRRTGNAVSQESNVAIEDDKRSQPVLPSSSQQGEDKDKNNNQELGLLEEHLQANPFPFGDYEEERVTFEGRLDVTNEFLQHVTTDALKSWRLKSFTNSATGSNEQHPSFPLNELPMLTFLEDTDTSFVYVTAVIDTTSLDSTMRKMLPSVTAALGAFLCPRPPGLDTDSEIENPNEYDPPMEIVDSQVSIGLNGEVMQCIFVTVIVQPEKYAWAVGLLHYVLYNAVFSQNFLKFVASEAARGLAANYRMQTPEKPNYDCFDSTELNLHALIKQIYKDESNARLFVGRRRLDLMVDYIEKLNKDPEGMTKATNDVWKHLVEKDRMLVQIAGDVERMKATSEDLVGPWKKHFVGIQMPKTMWEAQPSLETTVMNIPQGSGIAILVNQPRLPCLNIAITINPHDTDFPKLCMAAQLFSMAQKWIWSCWDLDDYCSPVIRMPCSYANLMTLNLESYDIIGCLKTMKFMMSDDWTWIGPLLTATKLMVVNDPATMELGPQGSIGSALLSHLANQPVQVRRDLLKDSMNVTVDDIKHVARTYFSKFFDAKQSCCALLTCDPAEKIRIVTRLEEIGYKMEATDLEKLCTTL